MTRRISRPSEDDDAAVWTHVTRSVTRLEGGKRKIAARTERGHEKAFVQPPVPETRRDDAPAPRAPRLAKAPLAGALEARKAKRIARGRDEIDARIDLHGMRQAEAHSTLRAFLHRAFQRGCRTVLVICGKGRDGDRDRHAPFDMYQDRERGVLRRNLPHWLAEPDLRAIVVGFAVASLRHGGEGAFYVQLRNAMKPRR